MPPRSPVSRPGSGPAPAPADEDDLAAFREAVRGAVPIAAAARVAPVPVAPPIPVQSLLDDHEAVADSLYAPLTLEQSMETGEELQFLRPGLQFGVLRKLRAGHWVVQGHIDLHGANREEAREMLVAFLQASRKKGLRCLRVVHGKGLGSPRREPVLRGKIRVWLAKRDEVLAYCQAPDNQGGSGATLVLLKI